MINELRGNLREAQERMKQFADRKRKSVEFEEEEWVWLKLKPHHQHSIDQKWSVLNPKEN